MNETTGIRTVELVRRIRDEQADRLKDMSDEEVIAFFRRAGEEARRDAVQRFGNPPRAARSA